MSEALGVQVLSPAEVSKLTTIKRPTLHNYVRDGLFPKPLKIGAKKRGWMLRDVEAWLETKREQ